ncbi:hypothetical protein H5410_017559 [Solanum commersonii]|uniref:Uncharacterized protein n=1 Tax=Solanum commersonii TaxID=4109 RepID=A0A9J6A0U4_SOLCO|nr:hypothetical protein H5410_017559 [Solanum commersonii]
MVEIIHFKYDTRSSSPRPPTSFKLSGSSPQKLKSDSRPSTNYPYRSLLLSTKTTNIDQEGRLKRKSKSQFSPKFVHGLWSKYPMFSPLQFYLWALKVIMVALNQLDIGAHHLNILQKQTNVTWKLEKE